MRRGIILARSAFVADNARPNKDDDEDEDDDDDDDDDNDDDDNDVY